MDGIRIEVTGNIARVIEKPTRITAGTVGLPVGFTFDSQWEGLDKTAVFKANRTCKIVGRLEDETVVPWEVLEKPGAWLSIGVYGVSKDGSIAIPTIWANVCPISASAHPEGDPSTDPSLLIYQELMNDIGDPANLQTEAKGNLVDAINEAHNIALSGGIETDETLSQKGKAAEAKATGDAIETAMRYATDYADSHIDSNDNPHGVTADQVGLGNVDNTSDMDKPVSTAQGNAIADAKKAGTDAKTLANKAQTTADNAKTTADNATTLANNAQTTANNAQISANNAQIAAENAERSAKIYADNLHIIIIVEVPASGWSASAPYKQSIVVDSVLASDTPHFGVVYSTDTETALAQKEAFAMVDDLDTANGSVTFTCFEDKPSVDLTIHMEVNR